MELKKGRQRCKENLAEIFAVRVIVMMEKGKKINKAVAVIARIMEIINWILVGLTAFDAVLCAVFGPSIVKFLMDVEDGDFSALGLSVNVSGEDGKAMVPVLIITLIYTAVGSALMAMIFRNINLVFKISVGASPFRPANVRLIRQIGIFAIVIPIINFIFSIAVSLLLHGKVDGSLPTESIFFGFVVLCLSRFFEYGVQLENDAEGLV